MFVLILFYKFYQNKNNTHQEFLFASYIACSFDNLCFLFY